MLHLRAGILVADVCPHCSAATPNGQACACGPRDPVGRRGFLAHV